MSFLTEATTRRMAMASRTFMTQAPRPFTTVVRLQKNPTETAKDTLKTVDRKVSDKLVDGIDAAASVAGKVKQSTEEIRGQAAGKTEELKGQAGGKTEELKGQAKGAVHEAAGKAKGAANKM